MLSFGILFIRLLWFTYYFFLKILWMKFEKHVMRIKLICFQKMKKKMKYHVRVSHLWLIFFPCFLKPIKWMNLLPKSSLSFNLNTNQSPISHNKSAEKSYAFLVQSFLSIFIKKNEIFSFQKKTKNYRCFFNFELVLLLPNSMNENERKMKFKNIRLQKCLPSLIVKYKKKIFMNCC